MFETSLPSAKRVEITLPVTFLGFSHAAESYVLYLQAAAGRAAYSLKAYDHLAATFAERAVATLC
jgi:hypothetical protein